MNAYHTWISRKQIGVVFANYKNGNLDISDDIVKFLYEHCSEVKGFNNNNRFEDVLQRVKSGIDDIFSEKYEEAAKEIKNAFELYHVIYQEV